MALFKRNAEPPTREELISAQIEDLDRLIERAPQRLLEERERARTMMPPPDSFMDREREKAFYVSYSKRQLNNERRFQIRNTILFVLSATAFLAVSWWIYAELVRNGFLG